MKSPSGDQRPPAGAARPSGQPQSDPTANRLGVPDTGPLLCFGAVPQGLQILKRHYGGHIKWTRAVADEIAHHARRRNRPLWAKAAQAYEGRRKAFLGEPVALTDAKDRAIIARIQGRIAVLEAQSGKGGRKDSTITANPKRNLGEAESICLAKKEEGEFLCSDNKARAVSAELRVPTTTVIDILKRDVAAGRPARVAYQAFRTMVEADLDPGGFVTNPLDFVPKK